MADPEIKMYDHTSRKRVPTVGTYNPQGGLFGKYAKSMTIAVVIFVVCAVLAVPLAVILLGTWGTYFR